MKKLYFITGLGCSGKTTLAEKLAIELNCQFISFDEVYSRINKDFDISGELRLRTPNLRTWDNLSFIGKKKLGHYKNLESCVKDYYHELCKDKPDLLVAEGIMTMFNPKEFEIFKKEFSNYDIRYLFINLNYEEWLDNRSKRFRLVGHLSDGAVPKFMSGREYKGENDRLRSLFPGNYLEINSSQQFNEHITEKSYQHEALNEPKWPKFGFDESKLKDKKFLDISCNSGWYLKKVVDAGGDIYGIDVDWRILDACLDRVPAAKIKVCRAEDLSNHIFGIEHFDYILCSSAFHYFTNRESVIEEISKLTDYFILELPVLEKEEDDILYQEQYHYAIPSRGLILKWLNKYFKQVEQIGETDYCGVKRPIFKAIK